MLYGAHVIFEFKDGKVVYHKKRCGKEHMYTEEDLVVLKLKAVEM
jgi:hypothetical protein